MSDTPMEKSAQGAEWARRMVEATDSGKSYWLDPFGWRGGTRTSWFDFGTDDAAVNSLLGQLNTMDPDQRNIALRSLQTMTGRNLQQLLESEANNPEELMGWQNIAPNIVGHIDPASGTLVGGIRAKPISEDISKQRFGEDTTKIQSNWEEYKASPYFPKDEEAQAEAQEAFEEMMRERMTKQFGFSGLDKYKKDKTPGSSPIYTSFAEASNKRVAQPDKGRRAATTSTTSTTPPAAGTTPPAAGTTQTQAPQQVAQSAPPPNYWGDLENRIMYGANTPAGRPGSGAYIDDKGRRQYDLSRNDALNRLDQAKASPFDVG
jgi:hypothetical protein